MVIHMKKKYLSRQSSDLKKWNVLYITYMCWNFKRRQHLLTKKYKMQRSVPPLIQGISEHVVFYLLGNIYYSVYRAKQRGIIASKNCQPCKKKYTHWKNKKILFILKNQCQKDNIRHYKNPRRFLNLMLFFQDGYNLKDTIYKFSKLRNMF